MNKKNIIIICLLAVGILLFCTIRFVILPANERKQMQSAENQTDALTHDIAAVYEFKSAYVGDAVNSSHLFYALPLNNVSMTFEIDPDTCGLTVNYLETVDAIGEEKVLRDLVYNAAAAMAAIDNLSSITYQFTGDTYTFDRQQLEKIFGAPLSALLEEDVWSEKVQVRLNDADFVGQFYSE